MTKLVMIKFGSHLYGTSTPESDVDYKAVHLPSKRDILLQRVSGSVSNQRAKTGGEKNRAGDVDEESYSLQRYLQLLVEGQTVAIDMLFAPDPLESSLIWRRIRENKDKLLTNKSAAFVGYCRTQANKYGIKGSRVAAAKETVEHLRDLVEAHPSARKLGEFEAGFATLLGEHTAIVEQVVNREGHVGKFLQVCNRKLAFDGTIKQAYEVAAKIHESYGSRARLALENEGVDWKALSHAVRVGQEALELMSTGSIVFPLRNAAEILAIKRGILPYAAVAAQIESLLARVEAASSTSVLRAEADLEFVDDLVADAYEAQVTRWA